MKKTVLAAFAIILSFSLLQAQENNENKNDKRTQGELRVKVKDEAKPDIYVDGVKFDFPMDLIDPDKIESISVNKNEGPNGTILITTKKDDEQKIKVRGYAAMNSETAPVVIINGEVSDQETLEKLSADDIESINVVKDEQAIEKYNAPNGAIIVSLKKEKK